ncbi:hypothetical protein OVA24_19045 [Luteolibacter sp. SL250]|uniref:hypothetical protein n=1 Tax=Luteolibacter sp. SL250 TaxID=2995170 RepID=UPI00226F820B|nr:hypothetical protein [Luteolibacter sp. SL250]WAC19327.1 hypothetical protein OVA24_19045 [Luteolibacter sp. SL250]
MKPSPCDSHQETISALTDDGLPFPEALSGHIASCPECAAFARICDGDLDALSAPLPSAGDDLRQRVLVLPAGRPARPRLPIAPLAAAAGILLAAGWWLTRPVPETPRPAPVVQNPTTEDATEIAALKEDFDQALGHLAEPLSVFSSLARP